MRSFRTAIMLAVAVLVASTAFAQSRGAGRIAGKVVDEKGQPVADVTVKAQRRSPALPAATGDSSSPRTGSRHSSSNPRSAKPIAARR
jgi:hypothetical protein